MAAFDILLIEDNPADVAVTRAAMDKPECGGPRLSVVSDGESARERMQANPEAPDLVLLDLNLPRRSGHEVLRDIRANEAYRAVPVVVVSSSERPEDIDACYRAGANCYVVKPNSFQEYLEVMEKLQDFWRNTVKLPS